MQEKIENVLDQYVRPILQRHDGDVEITEIEGETLYVRFLGQCSSCASSYYTLEEVLQKTLTEQVPAIKKVRVASVDKELYQYAKKLLESKKESHQ